MKAEGYDDRIPIICGDNEPATLAWEDDPENQPSPQEIVEMKQKLRDELWLHVPPICCGIALREILEDEVDPDSMRSFETREDFAIAVGNRAADYGRFIGEALTRLGSEWPQQVPPALIAAEIKAFESRRQEQSQD